MKIVKKLTSISLSLIMLLNMFLPMTVLAQGEQPEYHEYQAGGPVLSFSIAGDHTLEENGGHLVIDGNIVDPRSGQNNLDTQYYRVNCENNACTMSIDTSIESVSLNFVAEAYSLLSGETVLSPDTVFTENTNITVGNPVNNTNNNNNQQPYTYNENELSFTITLNMSNNIPQNFSFETNEINTRLEVTDGEHHTFLGIENGQHQEVQEQNIHVELSQDHKSAIIKIYNTDAGVMFSTPGDGIFNIDNYSGAYDLITQDTTLTIIEREQQAPFDGKVLLIWQCGNEACKHEFNLTEPQTMSYFLDSTITDDQDSTRKFDLKKAINGEIDGAYVLPNDLAEWETIYSQENSSYNFRTVDLGLMLHGRMQEIEHELEQNGTCEHTGNPGEFEHCVDEHAHPTIVDRGLSAHLSNGQEMGANSHIAYGDNIFKITVYTEDYVGLKEDESTYNYRRDRFESMYSESKDISGTTKENPYVLDTLLIEGKAIISSNNINGVEFKEVKALNVPEGAVEITKISDGKFQIKFNSNFYDRTIFEITDTNNTKYYVRIVRSIVSVSVHNNDPIINKNNMFVEVDLLFDDNQSWEDYEVNATIVSKDGTYKKETLTNLGAIDIGGGNVFYVQEKDFGQNLKIASFGLDLDGDEHYFESIEGIYINVRKSGSTDENYAGTYAGNGRGLFITGSEYGPIIDYSK
jgi:hypothetical protein